MFYLQFLLVLFAAVGSLCFLVWAIAFCMNFTLFPFPKKWVYLIGMHHALTGKPKLFLCMDTTHRRNIYEQAYADFDGESRYEKRMKDIELKSKAEIKNISECMQTKCRAYFEKIYGK